MPGGSGDACDHQHAARKTICLAQPVPDLVIHHGDDDFTQELAKLYAERESALLEGLINLKTTLRSLPQDEFWGYLAERMADLLGAQMSFISKRILVDDQDRAIEMPPIGEPGACLMASAMYYNDGRGTENTLKSFKYHAYGCPCGYMRHDKVFVIPERLDEFVPMATNPNELPFKLEAYIGIPLFAEGKCFAHFGLIWSPEGAKAKKLSWTTIELFLHSLEDIILERMLEGSEFKDLEVKPTSDRNRIIPHAAVTAAQSLKPYARSLSHELRTPMQGVVGMLDVMYATVLEACETQTLPEVQKIFEALKANIEVVQDSSRRAVEAADNVVHAYDMDLSLPAASSSIIATAAATSLPSPTSTIYGHERPRILVAGSDLPIQRPNKRRYEGLSEDSPNKIPATIEEWTKRIEPSEELRLGVHEAEGMQNETFTADQRSIVYDAARAASPSKGDRTIAPGLRHTQIREVLQYVVNEGLKVGGRPESAIAKETDLGETIEVKTRTETGEVRTTVIEWSVDPAVPTTMFVDERDLGKLISCVFLNAVKFTEQGKITVSARMSSRSRHVIVAVTDSGPGIPKAFLPRLFKPFSQEDPSLTRQREGLGLGLLVAKGIARKLGGDLMCTRADTDGPTRGCEFELRVPVSSLDAISRPPSPHDSPSAKSGRLSYTSETSAPRAGPTAAEVPPTPSSHDLKTPANPANGITNDINHTLEQTPKVEAPASSVPFFASPTADAAITSTPRKTSASPAGVDRQLGAKYPLTFLVAEDNKINRKLLVSMLHKFGYRNVHEAYDGAEAVRQMEKHKDIDVVLMDLWMPFMDGYEATEKILGMDWADHRPTVLAVTADVTDGALERAGKVGMKGFMTKPFKLLDLQRLILEYCAVKTEC